LHHPNTTPLKSSYFDYKIYPYREPPEFAKVNEQPHPVVIVGAGPIGLVLAIQLRKHGIACILIESEAQVSGGSRAVALTKRSMEIIEQSNAATRFLEKAITWREGRSFYKNQVVHHLRLPYRDDDKFEPMTNLAQCMMEDILVDEALAQGVDLRFQTALTAMKHEADGALLTLDTPQGEYRLKAEWVVACDGARSTVRRLMNLRYDGNSFETRFVIVDFKIDLDEPAGRRCYFDPPWLPGQTALMHKTPLGVWRLDYQVPEKLSDEEALDQERIRADVRAHLKYIGVDLPWEIEWTTLYKPNALTLSKYNHGHVIFCGDSAHLLPVFGVRGMNTGVQDSINLGWKLAAVIKKQAPEQILETYSAERVADARQICVEATRSTRMMAPPTRGHRILQQAVLSLALDHEWVRDLLHWRTSHPIDYAESPLNLRDATDAVFSGGPALGAPARNARLDPANRKAGWLLDHFGPAFQVLVFGADAGLLKEAIDDVEILRSRGIAVRLLSIRRQARSSAAQPGVDVALCDPEGHVSGLWGCDDAAVYVVRPDQHVCARWTVVGRARVREAIQRALMLPCTATLAT
jgi:3-(3-hydroxy-phenyl)propionate hydroxylase